MSTKEDQVKFLFKIKAGGKEIEVSCGNITEVSLNLFTYGFDASLQFCSHADEEIHTLLCSPDMAEVSLLIELPRMDKSLTLKGLITDKALLQEDVNHFVKEMPLLLRHYRVQFKDFAQASWHQHFPTALYVEKNMQEVFELQKHPSIAINYEFEAMSVKHPFIALGLGCRENSANFHSFVLWYLKETHALWEYNYDTFDYTIRDKKLETKPPIHLDPAWIQSIICHFPDPARATNVFLNGYAEDPKTKSIVTEQAYEQIKREALMCTAVASEFDKFTRTAPTTFFQQTFLETTFSTFPQPDLIPNSLISFENNKWSKNLHYKKSIYRILNMRIWATASNFSHLQSNNKTSQNYITTASALLEAKEEKIIQHPPFTPPHYPFYVEGKIFSEVGKSEHLTFQISKNEDTNQEYYLVEIPLWDNQKIIIPFEPHFLGGQFYFPLCNGERILIAFNLLTARIEHVLDWWSKARLPVEKQGNQIVFSPKKDEDHTIIHHSSEEENSLFKIERHFNKQIQTIQITKEHILLELIHEENSTPISSILIDHSSGITITNQNKDKEAIQKVFFNGESIHITCKDKENNSSFLQKPDSIAVECKKFSLNAEEIVFIAKDNFSSKIGKQYLVNSDETVAIQAKKSITHETDKLSLLAKNGIAIDGKQSVKITGAQIQSKGSKIEIESSSIANFTGKVVNINGKMTTIEGSMVKIN